MKVMVMLLKYVRVLLLEVTYHMAKLMEKFNHFREAQ